MLRSDLIATFVLIADAGSLNGAATKLGVSRSVVSERLAALETDLGAHLVTRSTRGLSLTSAGELFLEHARGLLAAMDNARDAVSDAGGSLTGRMRVAVPASFAVEWLTPVMARFLEANPRIELEVSASDRKVDIVQEGFDLAIRGGRLPNSDLLMRRLTTGRRVVVCSPDYAERNGVPRTISEIGDHQCVIYRNQRTALDWTFGTGRGRRTAKISGRFEADSGAMLKQAAVEGLGLSLIPTFIAAADLLAGRLVMVALETSPDTDVIAAVFPRAHGGIPRIRAFVDHLQTAFGDPPPWDRELVDAGLLTLD